MFRKRAWLVGALASMTVAGAGVVESSASVPPVPPSEVTFADVRLHSWWDDYSHCLGVSTGVVLPVGNLAYGACNNNSDQRWSTSSAWGRRVKDGIVYVHLVNAKGQCIGLKNGSTEFGTLLRGGTCTDADDQYWCVSDQYWAPRDYEIMNFKAGWSSEMEEESTSTSSVKPVVLGGLDFWSLQDW